MLSIAAMSISGCAYYSKLAREDYYLRGGEPVGVCLGKGATDIKLAGAVQPEQLSALFRGFGPDGKALVQNAGKEHRQPGWDLTFSAPKAVSTLWSQCDEPARREIQTAQWEAVKAALSFLENEFSLTRRGKAGHECERARLIVPAFEHSTSRELDPNLHIHALVMNACTREDGTVGTIRSKPFYEAKLAVGALYRAELAAQLESRLGIACERQHSEFAFSIKGVSEDLNKEFSKRRQAIEERLRSRGAESAEAASIATLDTRKNKEVVPPRAELFAMWKEIGRRFNFDPKQALGLSERTQNDSREFKKALETAVDRITSTESHFTKTELVRELAIEAQGRCLSAKFLIEQLHDSLKNSENFCRIGKRNGEQVYTTKGVLEAEKELIESAQKLKSRLDSHGANPKSIYNAFVNAERPLSEEQKEAVRHITQKGSGIRSLEGLAGTGKTTTLGVARQALESAGYRVIGATVSAKAAKELEDGAGIKSLTIESLRFRMNPSPEYQVKHHLKQLVRAALDKPTFKLEPLVFDKKTVLVLDEAAMISTRELAALATAVAKAGGMLVNVFDRKQLQAIGRGGGAAFLADHFGKAQLTEIVRQRNAADVADVKAFASGKAAEALRDIEKRGNLHVAENREAALKRLVADWSWNENGQREKALIFVGTRADVKIANTQCQSSRLRHGELSGSCFRDRGVSLYEKDRVLFTENSRKLGVQNGTLGTILELKHKQQIAVVKLDSGEVVPVPLKSYQSLTLGYAVTTHKGQGTTVENAYILAGGRMQDRELSYVQASRARNSSRIYTDRNEADNDLSRLAKQMSKTHEKTLAHQLIADREKSLRELRLRRELRI